MAVRKNEGEEEEEKVCRFYKNAFCIDGEAKVRADLQNFRITSVMELNDTKRSKFFIARVENIEEG